MTEHQEKLTGLLAEKKIESKFNGNFLNCCVNITNEDSGKVKRQKFSFLFDSADDCQGARLLPQSTKGAYSEFYATQAAEIIFEFSANVAQEQLN